jgi:hypothetical protein
MHTISRSSTCVAAAVAGVAAGLVARLASSAASYDAAAIDACEGLIAVWRWRALCDDEPPRSRCCGQQVLRTAGAVWSARSQITQRVH